MTGRDAMVRARTLIVAGWTTGEVARDAQGVPVDPDAPNATCWCLEGALAAATWSSATARTEAWRALLDRVRREGYRSLWAWNDCEDRTQADVLALLDDTIAEFDV